MSQNSPRIPIAQLNVTDEGLEVISNVTPHQKKFLLLIGDILALDFPEVKARLEITWKHFEPKTQ